uniref:Uncharacterized protein n=1 Tax=Toxoplasma gondii TgCATBr9 TaxID=943120 RepID=A0A2T6IYK3_TOXGO|nr:hypothetical protein TGBR9_381490 [Toxoplasma gondii TgCATBr9]
MTFAHSPSVDDSSPPKQYNLSNSYSTCTPGDVSISVPRMNPELQLCKLKCFSRIPQEGSGNRGSSGRNPCNMSECRAGSDMLSRPYQASVDRGVSEFRRQGRRQPQY